MNLLARLMAVARRRSPWVYVVNSGSCNGCDIEVTPTISPRYDGEQIGMLRQGSPKHADILLITGIVTTRSRQALLDIYHQMPGPKAVVALGSCPASTNVFRGSPSACGLLEEIIDVDVWVPGCPPRPQLILQGIARAAELLAEGRTANQLRASSSQGVSPYGSFSLYGSVTSSGSTSSAGSTCGSAAECCPPGRPATKPMPQAAAAQPHSVRR